MNKTIRLRQRLREPQEDEGYWPGYVDALVNVVLNLLFLLALLTLAAFVLGQKVGQNQRDGSKVVNAPATVASERVQNKAAPPHSTVAPLTEKIQVQTRTLDAAELQASRKQLFVLEERNHDEGMLISLNTPANAWFMSQAQTPEFLQDLKNRLGPAPDQIWVWTNTDADPQRQRQDYLRVIQVREWLQRAGVSLQHIHIRLNQGSSTQQEVAPVFIWVRPQRGEN